MEINSEIVELVFTLIGNCLICGRPRERDKTNVSDCSGIIKIFVYGIITPFHNEKKLCTKAF